MNFLSEYFPELTKEQIEKFNFLFPIYKEWNQKINLISRKDIDNFNVNHLLHSLAIAKVINFKKGTKILDVGTGGGFPGIPLAIFFPDCHFHLVDSIGKKIGVVQDISDKLNLKNVSSEKIRIEDHNEKYNFIVSRAVMRLPEFWSLVEKNILSKNQNSLKNGVLYLKGGDIDEEIQSLNSKVKIFEISNFFKEPYFETKKVVHIYKDKN
jgi:16S rRNA (guanine527-N7)-methyltransferase